MNTAASSHQPRANGSSRASRHGLRAEAVDAAEAVADRLRPLKPKLRGWLHAIWFPLALAGGIVMICLAPTTSARLAAVAYMIGATLLFGISALYHRFYWGSRGEAILRRFDHANIFLLIAGTYTPFAVCLLRGTDQVVLLTGVWGGAAVGVLFRLFWLSAPRWLYTPIYVALGWLAVFWLDEFAGTAGWGVVSLIMAGGLCYTVGAIVYGLKRPDPSPSWFGYHEIFHAFTIAAFTLQYIAASIVVYRYG